MLTNIFPNSSYTIFDPDGITTECHPTDPIEEKEDSYVTSESINRITEKVLERNGLN